MTDEPTNGTPQEEAYIDNEEVQAQLNDFFASIAAPAGGIHEAHVHGSVIDQTIRLVENYGKPHIAVIERPDGSNVPAVAEHGGLRVLKPSDFEAWDLAPRFRRGTATMLDLPSFIGHVNRYSDDHTIIFANNDRSSPSMTAVLDYHEAGAEGAPRFGKHRTAFAFPLSDEWKAWAAWNGKEMSMHDFAEFLEDRVIDIMPPEAVRFSEGDDEAKNFVDLLGGVSKIGSPQKLMLIATGLSVHENSVLQTAEKLASGEAKFVFQSDHTTTNEAGEAVIVPTMFALGIPVFMNDASYRVLARLRYRKRGATLVFWYDLWRTDKVFDHAFDEAVEKVQTETDKTVWLGKDEG